MTAASTIEMLPTTVDEAAPLNVSTPFTPLPPDGSEVLMGLVLAAAGVTAMLQIDQVWLWTGTELDAAGVFTPSLVLIEASCEPDQADHDELGSAESLFIGVFVADIGSLLPLALGDPVTGTVMVTVLPTPQASGTVVTTVVIAGLLGTGVSVHPQWVVTITVVFVSHPVGQGTTYVVVRVIVETDRSFQSDHFCEAEGETVVLVEEIVVEAVCHLPHVA